MISLYPGTRMNTDPILLSWSQTSSEYRHSPSGPVAALDFSEPVFFAEYSGAFSMQGKIDIPIRLYLILFLVCQDPAMLVLSYKICFLRWRENE